MPKKDTLKNILEEKINKERIYQKTLLKTEKRNMEWKYALTIFILVIGIVIPIVRKEQNSLNLNQNNERNSIPNKIVINKITNLEIITKETIKKENKEEEKLDVLKLMIMPKDIILKKRYNILDKKENTLLYKENIYLNKNKDRTITIRYSKEDLNLRKYEPNNIKSSYMDGYSFNMIEFKNQYFVELYQEEYYIDIETTDITEEELNNLLKSLIK